MTCPSSCLESSSLCFNNLPVGAQRVKSQALKHGTNEYQKESFYACLILGVQWVFVAVKLTSSSSSTNGLYKWDLALSSMRRMETAMVEA